MSANIEFEGLDEITEELAAMLNEEKIRRALGKACALVERAAKEKAPKGTGELRRSITSKVENGVGIVFTPLEYAPYVEFGTGIGAFEEGGSGHGRTDVPWSYQDDEGKWHTTCGQKPHTYMRPALNENREEIKRIIKQEVLQND
jgi:HK97 gp10 family phage protein